MFDIDGTLVDSNYLHVEAWASAMLELHHPVDSWRVHRAIGMDSSKLLEAVLADDADELGERASEAHSSHYAALADRLRPFEGARELLQTLADRGTRVVLATSAPEDELTKLRDTLDIEDALYAVTSSEDVETAKPEPDVITVALEKGGVQPEHAVMVGDTAWDGEAARRAGVRFVGVRSGGISELDLRDAGAVEVYDDVAALLRGLDSSVLASLTKE